MSAGEPERAESPPGVPLIIRIGGLAAVAVEPFSSDLDSCLERIADAARQVETTRAALIEMLFAAINGAPPEHRRFLLQVKRDCFNGRELAVYSKDPRWPVVLTAAALQAGAGLEAEERLAAAKQVYRERHAEQVARERRALSAAAGDLRLRRGIALSSVVVASQLERLSKKDPATWGRRERRLEAVLLRYLSRASLKLSPFATLTRLGIGQAKERAESGENAELTLFPPEKSRELSLVRLRRHLVEQWGDLLLLHPSLRVTLPVVVNDSTEQIGPDRYRFLTSGRWKGVDEKGNLEWVQPALVQVTLKGQLISWLLQNLKVPQLAYGDLLEKLGSIFSEADPALLRNTVDRLLEVQLLRLVPPFKSSDLVLEKSLRDALVEADPQDPRLAEVIRRLDQAIEIAEGFPDTLDPAAAVEKGRRATEDVWHAVAPLSGIDPIAVKHTPKEFAHSFFEDVLLDSGKRPGGGMIELPRRRASEILEQVSPLVRLANLFTFRHDFLYALGALAAKEWPGREEIPFLDFFEKGQKLFQDFVVWETGERNYRGLDLSTAFDPFGLPAVARLKSDRERMGGACQRLLERGPSDIVYCDPARFSALLDESASPAAARRDFTAFVQPTSAEGREWVLTGIFDGAGRLASRYTPLMEESVREWWTSYYVAASESRGEDGMEIERVDLYATSGQSINVHAPQTRRFLVAPSDALGVPPDRLLRITELKVRTNGEAPPILVDRQGKKIVPIYLGAIIHRFTPTLYKFLAAFGSGEIRSKFPYLRRPAVDGAEILPRHYLGDVVYSRRTWGFSPQAIPALRGLAETDAFAAVDAWRRAHGMPRRVFVAEPVSQSGFKPQYVDFTSPSLVELFRGMLEAGMPHLSISEALPSPDQLIPDGTGKAWAVEFQLDDQGL